MSLFHRSLRFPGLSSCNSSPPRLCLPSQPLVARSHHFSTVSPSNRLFLPLCSRHSSQLSFSSSISRSFHASCRAPVASSRLHAPFTSLPSSPALRIPLSTNFSSASASSSSSSSSSFQRSQASPRYSLPYLLLLGFTSASACFILGWYSHTAVQLYLHDLLPPSPTTTVPSAFCSTSVDILGYRLPLPVAAILAINLAVFAAWRVPSLVPVMYTHFTTDYYRVFRQGAWWTLVTHAFSHQTGVHLLFNCMAFATIAPSITIFMNDWQFVAFYLSSAAISALIGFALLYLTVLPANRFKQLRIPSLGASGAVYACFAASACTFPDSQYNILFIPYNIPASTILPVAAAFDVAGLVWNRYRGSPLGHGAHLGGMLCGIVLYKGWIERSPLLARVKAERERRRMWAASQRR